MIKCRVKNQYVKDPKIFCILEEESFPTTQTGGVVGQTFSKSFYKHRLSSIKCVNYVYYHHYSIFSILFI